MFENNFKNAIRPTDEFTRLNDYEIRSIFMEYDGGGRVDLKPLFQNITINEDINHSAISGSILIKDTTQLLNSFPISGHEKIVIEFRTPGIGSDFISSVFRVVQVNDRVRGPNDRTEVYRINFISESAFVSKLNKISKSYKGTISDIVSQVHSEFFETKISTDKTNGEYRFVIPYWTPLKVMEWLSMRAIPANKRSETNFLFFETLRGHNFKCLSELNSKDSVIEYTKRPVSQRQMDSGPSHQQQFTTIQELQIFKTNQKLEETMDGAFASSLLQHDVTTKSWSRTNFNYNNEIKKIRTTSPEKVLTSNSVYAKNPNAFINLTTKQQQLMGKDYPNTQNHEEWFQQALSSRTLLDTIKIKINVSGNSALSVGDNVNVFVPKTGEITKNNSEWYDKQLSGKYMIISLRHTITQDDYVTTMMLGKSGYEVGLPDVSTFMGTDNNKQTNILETR